MITHNKIVDFQMCKTCKHRNSPETEEPCDECLSNAVVQDSRVPLHYEEDTEAGS